MGYPRGNEPAYLKRLANVFSNGEADRYIVAKLKTILNWSTAQSASLEERVQEMLSRRDFQREDFDRIFSTLCDTANRYLRQITTGNQSVASLYFEDVEKMSAYVALAEVRKFEQRSNNLRRDFSWWFERIVKKQYLALRRCYGNRAVWSLDRSLPTRDPKLAYNSDRELSSLIPSTDSNPEEIAEAGELAEVLTDAVRNLSRGRRQVLLETYLGEKTADIASSLRKKRTAVTSLLHQAKVGLIEYLQANGHEEYATAAAELMAQRYRRSTPQASP